MCMTPVRARRTRLVHIDSVGICSSGGRVEAFAPALLDNQEISANALPVQTMEEAAIESVKTKVYQRFPEMRGVEPTIEERTPGPSPVTSPPRKMFVFTFRKTLRAEDGATITQTVRATVDEEGRVVKMVGSR